MMMINKNYSISLKRSALNAIVKCYIIKKKKKNHTIIESVCRSRGE